MKQKEILLFGGSGQIGRNLIRKLSKNNYKLTVVTRNIHQAGYILKTQANPGYLELVELENFNIQRIDELIKKTSICINLIGILYEKKKNQFNIIHRDFPDLISRISNKYKIEKLIHLSALGIEQANDSKYATSKIEGENKLRSNFKNSIILKPSIVYSVDDNFTTNFMSLLSKLPLMPLYYNGETKFSPIHATDLTNIIYEIIEAKEKNFTLECIGPEIFTFKEILKILLKVIKKNRILLPMPLTLASLSAKFLELFPKPLLTQDQLKLLKYHNIKSGLYKTNFDLGLNANKKFEIEVDKYSFNWRTGGQFTKKNEMAKLK